MAKEGALRAAGQNRKEMRDVSTRARPTAALESVFRGNYPPLLTTRDGACGVAPAAQIKSRRFSQRGLSTVCIVYRDSYAAATSPCRINTKSKHQLRQSQIPLKIYCLSEFVCCVPIPLGRITTRRRFTVYLGRHSVGYLPRLRITPARDEALRQGATIHG